MLHSTGRHKPSVKTSQTEPMRFFLNLSLLVVFKNFDYCNKKNSSGIKTS
jgi:hypothetical protein